MPQPNEAKMIRKELLTALTPIPIRNTGSGASLKGQEMSHLFRVGDVVTMTKASTNGVATGLGEIVRTLPSSTDDEPRYHVKCGADGLVRSARQSDLATAARG